RSDSLNSSTGSTSGSTSPSSSTTAASAVSSATPSTVSSAAWTASSRSASRSSRGSSAGTEDSDTVTLPLSSYRTATPPGGHRTASESAAEDPQDGPAENGVETVNNANHNQHEHHHDGGVRDQVLACRPDDLPELADDLTVEEGRRSPLLLLTTGLACGLAARVDRHSPHLKSVVSNAACGAYTPLLRGPHSQGTRDSNPQPPVLETGALPIAPVPYVIDQTTLTDSLPGPNATSTCGGRTWRKCTEDCPPRRTLT